MKKTLISIIILGLGLTWGTVYAVDLHKKKTLLQGVGNPVAVLPMTNHEINQSKDLSSRANSVVVKKPIILVYHSVEPKTDKKEGKMQKHYHIYPENFKAQLQYLKDNKYTVISMKSYIDYLTGQGEISEKSVVLTFDDGWKNQYLYAYPLLKEFHYPATFYIITKSTDGKTYMSWSDISDLDKAGMDIESHTQTHPNLTKIDEKKARDELILSKKTLEEKLGHAITQLAYPYYGNNQLVQKMVQEAGYLSARAGWTKTINSKNTLFDLQSQEAVNNKNPFSSSSDIK